MAKTLEHFVQESLGTLMLQLLNVQAQLETEREKVKFLQDELAKKEEKK